jgi:hypothetical protein
MDTIRERERVWKQREMEIRCGGEDERGRGKEEKIYVKLFISAALKIISHPSC